MFYGLQSGNRKNAHPKNRQLAGPNQPTHLNPPHQHNPTHLNNRVCILFFEGWVGACAQKRHFCRRHPVPLGYAGTSLTYCFMYLWVLICVEGGVRLCFWCRPPSAMGGDFPRRIVPFPCACPKTCVDLRLSVFGESNGPCTSGAPAIRRLPSFIVATCFCLCFITDGHHELN